jgi:hypothetical protein
MVPGHARTHEPQCAGSLSMSTQAPSQHVWAAVQPMQFAETSVPRSIVESLEIASDGASKRASAASVKRA